jgi:hypothetical protein
VLTFRDLLIATETLTGCGVITNARRRQHRVR